VEQHAGRTGRHGVRRDAQHRMTAPGRRQSVVRHELRQVWQRACGRPDRMAPEPTAAVCRCGGIVAGHVDELRSPNVLSLMG
jgi:hypothetical protein